MRHDEDNHACWLTEWRIAKERNIPELKFLYHWPQGGKRSKVTAAILKRMGVRKGPWDFWLLVRRGDCPGLIIELKHGRNKLTPEQEDLGNYLEAQGWATAVCYHWRDAAREIVNYLGYSQYAKELS